MENFVKGNFEQLSNEQNTSDTDSNTQFNFHEVSVQQTIHCYINVDQPDVLLQNLEWKTNVLIQMVN